jgi:hypothetical protein
VSRSVRYGVQVEFTVDGVLEGGPSRIEIRRVLRGAMERLQQGWHADDRWRSLRDIRIKYLHEATSTQYDKKGRAIR